MGLFKKVIIANEVAIYSSAVFNGANRKRSTKRNINLFLTMWLVGLWHGAGWTFVVWGRLYGLYFTINNFWHS